MLVSSLHFRFVFCAVLLHGTACAPPPAAMAAAPKPAPLFLAHEEFQRIFAPSADPEARGRHFFVDFADLAGDSRPEALVTQRTIGVVDQDRLLLFSGDRQHGWTLLHEQNIPGSVRHYDGLHLHQLGERRWIEATSHSSGTWLLEANTCLLEYREGGFDLVADSVTYLEFNCAPTGICIEAQAGPYQIAEDGELGAVRASRRLLLSALPSRDFEPFDDVDFEVTLVYGQSAPGLPWKLMEAAGLHEADRNGLVGLAARRWIAAKWEVARNAALVGTPQQLETLRAVALLAGEDEWAAQLKALLPPEPVPDPVALQDY